MKFLCLAYGDEDRWNLPSDVEKHEARACDQVIRQWGDLAMRLGV